MKKEELINSLLKLGLDGTGKRPFLQARLIDYIALNSGEQTEPRPLDIDLKALKPKNMKVKELKELDKLSKSLISLLEASLLLFLIFRFIRSVSQ